MPAHGQAGGQIVDAPLAPESAGSSDDQPQRVASTPTWRSFSPRRYPISTAIVACVVLGALSAAVFPTVPSYDPWSWIVWGREVVDPHLSFATGGGPSWKPLPVFFTTVYALVGGAAPTLWVITARIGGLLGLVAAWRLAARLIAPVVADDQRRTAETIAGLVAVLGIVLTQDWVYYMLRGTSEPMLIAAALWAIDRLLDRKHGVAFAIAIAGALIRPEFWPFVGVYGLWLWFKEPRLRVLIVLGFASIPVFWFGPPWIGSGQPFLAAVHAQEYNGHLGSSPVITAIKRAIDLQVTPVLIAAAVAVVWTWVRERDRTQLALFAGALVWIAIVVGMVVDGYPGLERFFLPAAAVFCVLAGVGVARLALAVGAWAAALRDRAGSPGPAAGSPPAGSGAAGSPPAGSGAAGNAAAGSRRVLAAGAILVAVVVLGVSIPFASSRISTARAQEPTARTAVTTLDQLSDAVKAVGGHDGVFPCRSSFAAVNHGVQTALAWKAHVTMGRVGTTMRHSGLDFIGPHNSVDGGPAAIDPRLTQSRVIAQVGVWKVVQYWIPGHLNRCVGGGR